MSKKHDSYESIRDERRYGPYWYSALWRIIRPILIGLGAVLVVAGILFSVWNKVYGEFIAPPDENSTAQVPFTIESGQSLTRVANRLEEAGLIRNRTVFKYYCDFAGASMEVYGAYLFVRLDKSSGFYLKTDGTRTEFTGESFSRGEYEEIYKQGVYHHPTAQFAFVPECTLTADEVSRSVWYDAKTGDFLDLQGNVLREAVQDGKPLYDSVRYYGGDYMLTKKDRLSGIVDMTGQEIVPPMYDTLGGDYAGLLFEGGYQAALEGGKLRFLTRDGQVSASVDYELKENDWKGLTNNAPMIYAEMNGKISVFTATRGELPTQYEEAARGQAGQELLAVKQDGLWGCIGMDGEVVVPFVMKYAPEISFDGRYVVGSTAEGYQLFTISYGE